MQEIIKAGTVLIKDGASFPDSFTFESEAYSPGWRAVTGLDGYAMDRKTQNTGWTFFYLAGESTTTAFGREGQATIRKAINKILPGLKSEDSNSLEITRVVFKHFLGMPCATVSFHIRNMQKGMFLLESGNSRAWRDATFVTA